MKALIINCSPVRAGATAEIVRMVSEQLSGGMETETLCIDDYSFAFCKGCRSCHQTAQCVQNDDIPRIMDAFERADIIVCVSPSYWADIPGQFKAFIDRCTPWCNTHEPHRKLSGGKKGYAIALRTGPNLPECERVIGSIEHFYGHLEIQCCGHLGLTGVENKQDAAKHEAEIAALCRQIADSADSVIGRTVTVTVDRPLGSYHPEYKDMYYPVNYGYIEGIIAPDGEEQDAYILGVDEPVAAFTGRIIAIVHRADDVEEKWVVCPEQLSFTKEEIAAQIQFQEKFYQSEIIM